MGPRHAETLSKLGLQTLGDMLYYYPRRYDDYSQLKPIKDLFYGEQVTVIGTIQSVHSRPIRGGKATIIEVIISDGTAGLRLSFFNQPWLANRFKQGEAISVSGKVDQYLGRLVMNSPDWESVEVESLHTNRIVPVYPLTEDLEVGDAIRLTPEVYLGRIPGQREVSLECLQRSGELGRWVEVEKGRFGHR